MPFQWGFSMWLEVGPKETNNRLAPMAFRPFYQLLTSPKLPLFIFNTTIKYNCILDLINKIYPKTLLYIQPIYKIFVVIQSHEG